MKLDACNSISFCLYTPCFFTRLVFHQRSDTHALTRKISNFGRKLAVLSCWLSEELNYQTIWVGIAECALLLFTSEQQKMKCTYCLFYFGTKTMWLLVLCH